MTNKVLLVEFPDEAQAALTYLEKRQLAVSDFRVIGLEPSVRAFLKRQRVECTDTLPYFDNTSHGRVLQKSEELVQLMDHDLRLDLGDGLKEAYRGTFVFYARPYLNSMLKTIEVLEGIRRAHPGSTLFICSEPGSARRDVSPLLQPDDRFTASLTHKFRQQYGLSLETITPLTILGQPTPAGSNGRSRLERILDWFIARCYVLTLEMQSRSRSVLASTLSYNLDGLIRSINARFPQVKPLAFRLGRKSRWEECGYVLFWLLMTALRQESDSWLRTISLDVIKDSFGGSEGRSVRETVEKIIADFVERNGDRFVYRGVSFLDEFLAKVRSDLIPYLVTLYKLAQAQACVLTRLRPSLVLSPFSVHMYHALGELCGMHNVPAMVIPQKTLVTPKNELEAIEEAHIGRAQMTNEYAFAAVQTPLALGYMQYTNYSGHPIPTGPLIFSKVEAARRQQHRARFFEKMGNPGQVILYAPSMKSRRASRFHVVETLDEVLSSMTDVVEAVTDMEGVYLILRTHPGAAIKRGEIETLIDLPGNVIISDRGAFVDVLALADVLISYSSTCTEEALQNGIPVILCDKWGRYNHLSAPLVRTGVPDTLSPAYYVSSSAHLRPTLKWVLNTHSTQTIPPSLLTRYVFDKDLNQNFYDFVEQIVERAS